MNIPKTISFVPMRPSLGNSAETLCHIFKDQSLAEDWPKANIVASADEALSLNADDNAIVLIISYADFDLAAAKSLMGKAAMKKIIFVAVDAPVNFSFIERLRSRAHEYLPEKIIEMPTQQKALPNFIQLIFSCLRDNTVALLQPTPSYPQASVRGVVPLRPDLFVTAELLGFPLSDMCKLEAEKFSNETGIPCPYAESADETHAKITQIMRKNITAFSSDKEGDLSLPPKRRLVVLSFVALCDQYRKLNSPEEDLMYSELFFLKIPKEQELAPLFALVEVMHSEYRAIKDNGNVGIYYDKAMQGIIHAEDPQARNFLSALVAHIYLAMTTSKDKSSELRTQFEDALVKINEEQKAFFTTPATNAVNEARVALEDVM